MKVTHVLAEDWEGVYFGNEIVAESNSISAGLVLGLLVGKSAILDYEVVYISDSTIWLDARDCLPDTLEEFYKLQEEK